MQCRVNIDIIICTLSICPSFENMCGFNDCVKKHGEE